jgi:hypothetical protein
MVNFKRRCYERPTGMQPMQRFLWILAAREKNGCIQGKQNGNE